MRTLNIVLAGALVFTAILRPEAAQAQVKPGAAVGGRDTVQLKVCNHSGRGATVAVSYVEVGDQTFTNRGWYDVQNGACRDLVTTDNSNFYFYADSTDGSGRTWQGNHSLCVQYPGPYTFRSTTDRSCGAGQEIRGFVAMSANEPGPWTWTLDP